MSYIKLPTLSFSATMSKQSILVVLFASDVDFRRAPLFSLQVGTVNSLCYEGEAWTEKTEGVTFGHFCLSNAQANGTRRECM